MNVVITPSPLSGAVRVPASKSTAHRLLIAAALADGPTRISISAMNRDIEATAACLRALGAGIEAEGDAQKLSPIAEIPAEVTLDCGESGSTLRFLLPVAAALGARA
ncbi:MAG: 3-phosphoshikimate 1-carboxyvinyltransferase, partial [Clostridia bacterium]|nr:3-phosphoshikimate 1-carboxyvinyltransferase [Clostridia bacterium]